MSPPRVAASPNRGGFNPVAQAVARAKLRAALVDQKIRLYLMSPGEPCADLMQGLGSTLSLVGFAAELSGLRDDHRLKILRGGLSACRQLFDSGRYDPLQTVAIAGALDAAEQLNRKINPKDMDRAVHALGLLEAL